MKQPEINEKDYLAATSDNDKIRFLLRYAQLAPSTHNIQPWLFKVAAPVLKIYFNPKLTLPEGDALGRDLYISIGCCIENLVTAATYFGLKTEVAYKDGADNLAAVVTFS